MSALTAVEYVLPHEFLPKGGKIEIVWAPGQKRAEETVYENL